MKEIFFKGLVIALPLCVFGGLAYLIFHGFYSFYSDIKLKKELEAIARESAAKRKEQPEPIEPKKAPTAEDFFRGVE